MSFADVLNQTVTRLRAGLKRERDYAWRMEQLRALKRLLTENDEALCQAMYQDLRKSRFECQSTEQGVVRIEVDDALRNLKSWMKPRKVGTPLFNWPGRSHVTREPLGLTLVIGAWNYPINLTLAPLVAAIAGGNACLIKPSEISAQTSALLARLVPRYLDPELFAVLEGGAAETSAILDQPFDFIFFTGSAPVGKIVLGKAAAHLTPVALELGGKSPALVLADADVAICARRIAWGKFMNAGQTCVAPDYVIVLPELRDRLVKALGDQVREFYGADVKASPDYCRIVNAKNFDRLTSLCEGEEVLHGGARDRESLYFEPTLVNARPDSPVMREEIFGPILPILTLSSLGAMIEFVNARPKPLSLYMFTSDGAAMKRVERETSSGAVVVNDVVIHMPVSTLPFGGVGASGMGNYHGRFGFETFTHAKSVLRKTKYLDLPVRYPPYSARKAYWLSWLLR